MPAPRWRGHIVLDWSKSASLAAAEPCVLCGRPTPLRSPAGAACHKTCAEQWTAIKEDTTR